MSEVNIYVHQLLYNTYWHNFGGSEYYKSYSVSFCWLYTCTVTISRIDNHWKCFFRRVQMVFFCLYRLSRVRSGVCSFCGAGDSLFWARLEMGSDHLHWSFDRHFPGRFPEACPGVGADAQEGLDVVVGLDPCTGGSNYKGESYG